MKWEKRILIAMIIFVLLCFVVSGIPYYRDHTITNGESRLELHFIDVGQGDAILLRCGSHAMLVDGGTPGNSSRIYTYLTRLKIDHLDYIVATHAHDDHAGGLAGALNAVTVDAALANVPTAEGRAFQSFLKYLEKQNVSITVPNPGDRFDLGEASFTVLGPLRESENVNDTSLVLLVNYGGFRALLTGDAETGEERDLLAAGIVPDCDLLKVGHHGSANASSQAWVDAVQPKVAVISCEKDNDYGHPAAQTLERLTAVGAEILRTDLLGDIVIYVLPDGTYSVQSGAGTQLTQGDATYIINLRTGKFHDPDCPSAREIASGNRLETSEDRETLLEQGYEPCGRCKP